MTLLGQVDEQKVYIVMYGYGGYDHFPVSAHSSMQLAHKGIDKDMEDNSYLDDDNDPNSRFYSRDTVNYYIREMVVSE